MKKVKWKKRLFAGNTLVIGLLISGIVTFIIPLIVFLIKGEFLENWAGPFWNLTSVFAVTIFSYLIYQHTKALETPIVTAESVGYNGKPHYILKNVGQVSAINILLFINKTVKINKTGDEGEYDYMVIIGSINPNSQYGISWEQGIEKITITYQAFNGEEYTSIIINDHLFTSKKNMVGVDSRGEDLEGNKIFSEGKISDFLYGTYNPQKKWIRYSTLMQHQDFSKLAGELTQSFT